MISSSISRGGIGTIGVLSGLLCEAAAALPFVAPEVIWVTTGEALWCHLIGALLVGGGSASLVADSWNTTRWIGPAFLFVLLALLIPGVGLLAVLLLSLVLVTHHAQSLPAPIPFAEVRPVSRELGGSVYGPGPLPQPLVALVQEEHPEALQKIVLGLETMPPLQTASRGPGVVSRNRSAR